MAMLAIEENDEDEVANLEVSTGALTKEEAKVKIKSLVQEKARREDYQNRLERKLAKLDADLAQRREEVESVQRTLQLERSKKSDQAKSDQKEREQKGRAQIERIRGQMDEALFRNAPRKDPAASFEMDTVLVSFTGVNEPVRYNLTFRLDKDTTVKELRDSVCKYWGVQAEDYEGYVLKTMGNSKCHSDLRVKECFKHGEIAALRLENRQVDNADPVTESEKKAIQPKRQKAKGGLGGESRNPNEKAIERVKAFNDNYNKDLKRLGGIYFLLKLRDSKPSEHASKIKLRDFVIYLIFAVLTLGVYNTRRPDGQAYWTRKGVVDAFMAELPPEYYPAHNFSTSPPDQYWTKVPKLTDVFRRSDLLWWLNTTLPAIIWGSGHTNSTSWWLEPPLRQYNLLPGYVAIRVQSVKKPKGSDKRWAFCDKVNEILVESIPFAECQKEFIHQYNQQTENLNELKTYWDEELSGNQTSLDIRGPSKPWQWKSHDERGPRGSDSLAGKIAWYDGSGYMAEYRMNLDKPMAQIDKYRKDMAKMRETDWISTRSRVVIVSLTTYNFQYDLWTASDLIFELPPGGAVKTTHTVRVFRPALNENSHELSETLVDVCRLILSLYVFVFVGIAERRHKTKNHKAGFLYHVSLNGIADIGMVGCTCVATIWRFAAFVNVTSNAFMVDVLDELGAKGYMSTSQLAYEYNTIFVVEGILFVLIMYRLLSLFRIGRTIYLLWHTIGIALKTFCFLIGLFLPAILGFVCLSHSVFGQTMDEFETIEKTILQIYRLLQGDAPFMQLMKTEPVWTMFFITLFYVIMKLCLFSIFAFTVVDAYYIVQLTTPSSAGERWDAKRWYQWAVPPLCVNMFQAMWTRDSSEGG
jgi:hypothetical protein